MIKFLCKTFLLIVITISFNTCDILRTSPFEVTSWSPGGGYHGDLEEIKITLDFSLEPDRASVERHFTLTENDSPVKGNFLWEGKKLTFAPLSPLSINADYNINLSAEAHDAKGLSMDNAFDKNFTTRSGNERPVLLDCYPSMYANVSDLKTEIRLEFSLPVPLKTLYDNVYFTPSTAGFWRLENGGKTAIFSPSEPWQPNKRYEIRFSTALTDNKNMNIGNDFFSVFTTGEDFEAPELLYAKRVSKDGGNMPLELDTSGYMYASDSFIESCGWEKEDKLLLVFSKPVNSASVKNCTGVEGASGLAMENGLDFNTDFIFYFESRPLYESRFKFIVKAGIKDNAGNESKNEYAYRIFANGKFSMPPELHGIRLPMAPGSETNRQLMNYGINSLFADFPITEGSENYPPGKSVETWVELYFNTAHGAAVDLFSLMELFRVETSNNVLTFSARKIKSSGFSEDTPQAGWENMQRVEISGTLSNSVNFGIVNFIIGSGLKDSLDNKNENLQRVSLDK